MLPSMQASGSGDGLQISLDLNEGNEGNEDNDWEDVGHLKTSGSQEQDKVRGSFLFSSGSLKGLARKSPCRQLLYDLFKSLQKDTGGTIL